MHTDPIPGAGPERDADRELLDAFRERGDQEALMALFARHADAAYRLARRLSGNGADAEDAVQDGFVQLIASARQYRGSGSVQAWILALVANAYRRRARHEGRRHRRERVAASLPPPFADQVDEPLRAALAAGLDELPERYRLPVAMRHLDGLGYGEIAAALRRNEATVRSQVDRGLDRLRAALDRRGVALSALALAAGASAAAPAPLRASLARLAGSAAAPPAAAGIGLGAVAALAAAGTLALGATMAVALRGGVAPAAATAAAATPSPTWSRGLADDPAFFPLGVWTQDPVDAPAWRAAGINLYVRLWHGPSDADLAALAAAGMRTICAPNGVGLRHRDDPTIAGWLDLELPDARHGGDDGLVEEQAPAAVAARHAELARLDPSRPALLTLGDGLVVDRDARGDRAADYVGYAAGGDVLGVLVNALNDSDPARRDLRTMPRALDRLAGLAPGKPRWAWIECTRIWSATPAPPSPAQIRAEAWLALIHGARGLVWFVHELTPREDDAAPLHQPALLATLTAIDREVAALATVLNRGEPVAQARADGDPAAPVDLAALRHAGTTYLFAASANAGPSRVAFAAPGAGEVAEALGEGRALAAAGGRFSDDFAPYAVHLYALRARVAGDP